MRTITANEKLVRARLAFLLLTLTLAGCGSLGSGELPPGATCAPDPTVESEDCTIGEEGNTIMIHDPQDLQMFCDSPCTRIAGSLQIHAMEGVRDLRALGRIEEVEKLLSVGGMPDLESLRGLEKLRKGGRFLDFSINPKLRSLEGLEGLREAGSLELRDNPELRSLEALEVLKSTRIYGNARLPQCQVIRLVERLDAATSLTSGNDNDATCD